MNHSEIRKHLKKGELAVETLSKLGWLYVENEREHPHWVAPANPQDALKEALQALIDMGIAEGVKKALPDALKKAQESDPRGPNWHLVEGLVKKDFAIRPENIPVGHQLRGYGFEGHFRGRHFTPVSIEYRRDPSYTGYAVSFNFATRPYRPETVWVPLSACAFRP